MTDTPAPIATPKLSRKLFSSANTTAAEQRSLARHIKATDAVRAHIERVERRKEGRPE